MSGGRDYGISARARAQCRTLGISPEAAESYARQAAPFTGEGFNRRYETYVFRVERRTIEDIGLFEDHSPRTRLKTEGPDPAQALLGRAFETLEEIAREPNVHWDSDLIGDLETLIDDLETFLKN